MKKWEGKVEPDHRLALISLTSCMFSSFITYCDKSASTNTDASYAIATSGSPSKDASGSE